MRRRLPRDTEGRARLSRVLLTNPPVASRGTWNSTWAQQRVSSADDSRPRVKSQQVQRSAEAQHALPVCTSYSSFFVGLAVGLMRM